MTEEKFISSHTSPSISCKTYYLWTPLLIFLFLIIASFYSWHMLRKISTPEMHATESERGTHTMNDFCDAIYYPVIAFLDGKNPYDAVVFTGSYPVSDVFPPYLPMTLLLHLPLGFLSFRTAAIIYFLTTLVLTIVFSWLCLRMLYKNPSLGLVFFVASLILLSRPGQKNLSLGQCTITVAIGLTLAMLYVQKPIKGGLGLALACYKPTFGIPLVILLLAQGHIKSVLVGTSIAFLLSFIATLFIFHNTDGVHAFIEPLLNAHTWSERKWSSNPITSPVRIDLKGVVGRMLQINPGIFSEVLFFICIVGIASWILWKRRTITHKGNLEFLDIAIYVLVPLTCLFHQEYDLVVLTLPLVVLGGLLFKLDRTKSFFTEGFLFILLSVPLMNYLQSATIQNHLGIIRGSLSWRLVASINGIFILLALLILFRYGLTTRAHIYTNSSQKV